MIDYFAIQNLVNEDDAVICKYLDCRKCPLYEGGECVKEKVTLL